MDTGPGSFVPKVGIAGIGDRSSPINRPSPVKPSPVNDAALAESLLLVRASTMKMVRLQLAMERRDRATALQAMDELVAIDARIGHFLDGMPANDSGLEAIRRDVDAQRSALAREKFGLAAGFRKRDDTDLSARWNDDAPRARVEPPASIRADGPDASQNGAEQAGKTPWAWIAIGIFLLAGAIAFLLLEGSGHSISQMLAISQLLKNGGL